MNVQVWWYLLDGFAKMLEPHAAHVPPRVATDRGATDGDQQDDMMRLAVCAETVWLRWCCVGHDQEWTDDGGNSPDKCGVAGGRDARPGWMRGFRSGW